MISVARTRAIILVAAIISVRHRMKALWFNLHRVMQPMLDIAVMHRSPYYRTALVHEDGI